MGVRRRVAVALSGGVDSAVACARMVDAGYDVLALHGKEWSGEWAGTCPAAADAEAARATAEHLGVPFTLVNCERPYREQVFSEFLEGIERGVTPNPDVACNRVIKFGVLAEAARALGAEALVTGHYARTARRSGQVRLLTGVDARKDQSYFLCTLRAEQLRFAEFPLGSSTKAEVRAEAIRRGLPVARRAESMGLCFVGAERFPEFLRAFVPERPGRIVDEDGAELGWHRGTEQFTIGQRHGLHLGGGPYYVAAKDSAQGTLTVVRGRAHPRLLSYGVRIPAMHWIHPTEPPRRVLVRFRHQQPLIPARIEHYRTPTVRFDAPAWAATPGQVLAVYAGDTVLGGGAIEEVLP